SRRLGRHHVRYGRPRDATARRGIHHGSRLSLESFPSRGAEADQYQHRRSDRSRKRPLTPAQPGGRDRRLPRKAREVQEPRRSEESSRRRPREDRSEKRPHRLLVLSSLLQRRHKRPGLVQQLQPRPLHIELRIIKRNPLLTLINPRLLRFTQRRAPIIQLIQ